MTPLFLGLYSSYLKCSILLSGHQYIYWDPHPEAFLVPWIHYPILWYSLLFAAGFLGAYLVGRREMVALCTNEYTLSMPAAQATTDHLTWYLFLGMMLGARLCHVFFYDWDYFRVHPQEILLTQWKGLASHGGACGILVALVLFWYRYRKKIEALNLWRLLDIVCLASALAAGCIRIGNFFNQEIIGTPSTLPWAIVFGHPAEHVSPGGHHPVQLYESLFYFATFGILFFLKKRLRLERCPGMLAGIFLLLVFTFRFFIEFLKLPQSVFDVHHLHMGQLLSIPFLLLGAYLVVRSVKKS